MANNNQIVRRTVRQVAAIMGVSERTVQRYTTLKVGAQQRGAVRTVYPGKRTSVITFGYQTDIDEFGNPVYEVPPLTDAELRGRIGVIQANLLLGRIMAITYITETSSAYPKGFRSTGWMRPQDAPPLSEIYQDMTDGRIYEVWFQDS